MELPLAQAEVTQGLLTDRNWTQDERQKYALCLQPLLTAVGTASVDGENSACWISRNKYVCSDVCKSPLK